MDINDNTPDFSQVSYHWSITEGTYVQWSVLGYIEAEDADSGDNQQLKYSLLGSG